MTFLESLRHGVTDIARAFMYDPIDLALIQPDPNIPQTELVSPAVTLLLANTNDAFRAIGHLANGDRKNVVTQITREIVANNGALPVEEIQERTGIERAQVVHTARLFSGHFVIEHDIFIAVPLLPKL